MKPKYFEMAKRLSKRSDHHQHRLGSVIVKKNRVIGFGFNQCKTHTQSPHKYKRLHAEISAIIGLSYEELDGAVIYVYREMKSGEMAMARPCPTCYEAIKLSGIRKICYTDLNGYKEELLYV